MMSRNGTAPRSGRKSVKTPSAPRASAACSGIKKSYLKSKPVCKVTFRLPGSAAPEAAQVHIVGEFNNWSVDTTPMKRLSTGDFSITLELEAGRDYQFRYLIDSAVWENDHNADRYVKSPFGDCDNSVVTV